MRVWYNMCIVISQYIKDVVTFLLCCFSSASSILLYVEFLLALLLLFRIFSSSLFSLFSLSNSNLFESSSPLTVLSPDFFPTFISLVSAPASSCISDISSLTYTIDDVLSNSALKEVSIYV